MSNLYTVEFFRSQRARLAPDGIICQWIQAYDMELETLQLVFRTFKSVFSHAFLLRVARGDLLLIGSAEPVRIDFDLIARRMQAPAVGGDLASIGVIFPLALPEHRQLEQMLAGEIGLALQRRTAHSRGDGQ